MTLRAAARRLRIGRPLRRGSSTWYVIQRPGANGVLQVTRGKVREVGVADKRLTRNRSAVRRFFAGFR
jgi:hypothetical protein